MVQCVANALTSKEAKAGAVFALYHTTPFLSLCFLRRKIWQCQATQKREAIMFNFSPFDLELLHVASYVLLLLIWPAHCLHGCNATTTFATCWFEGVVNMKESPM